MRIFVIIIITEADFGTINRVLGNKNFRNCQWLWMVDTGTLEGLRIVSGSLMASEEAVSEILQKKEEILKLKERELLLCTGRKFCKTTCDKVASRKCI